MKIQQVHQNVYKNNISFGHNFPSPLNVQRATSHNDMSLFGQIITDNINRFNVINEQRKLIKALVDFKNGEIPLKEILEKIEFKKSVG